MYDVTILDELEIDNLNIAEELGISDKNALSLISDVQDLNLADTTPNLMIKDY